MATHIILQELTCWHSLHYIALWIMPQRQSFYLTLYPSACISSFIFVFACGRRSECVRLWMCVPVGCVCSSLCGRRKKCVNLIASEQESETIVAVMGRSFWAPLAYFELLPWSCSPPHKISKNDSPPHQHNSTFTFSFSPFCVFSLPFPIISLLTSASPLYFSCIFVFGVTPPVISTIFSVSVHLSHCTLLFYLFRRAPSGGSLQRCFC